MSEDTKSFTEIQSLHVRSFTAGHAMAFKRKVEGLIEKGQPVIPVYINSPGGSADACRAMLDVIDMAKNNDVPVATIALGLAASAGAILLAGGTKGMRFATPRATIMVHGASGGGGGKLHDIQVDAALHEKYDRETFAELDAVCGKRKGYWQRLLAKQHMADLYMTAEEAKNHGLVDHVATPRFQFDTQISVGCR